PCRLSKSGDAAGRLGEDGERSAHGGAEQREGGGGPGGGGAEAGRAAGGGGQGGRGQGGSRPRASRQGAGGAEGPVAAGGPAQGGADAGAEVTWGWKRRSRREIPPAFFMRTSLSARQHSRSQSFSDRF